MKTRRAIVDILAAVIWLTCMALIYLRNYPTNGNVMLAAVPGSGQIQTEAEYWYDVTMSGQKIGYAMNSLKQSALGWVFKDYSLLRLPMGGTTREVLMDFYAVVDTGFRLKNLTFGISSEEYSTNVYGQVGNGKLEIKMQSGDELNSIVLDCPDGVFLPGTIPLILAEKDFPKGEFSLPCLDPVSLTINDIHLKVTGPEKASAGGSTFDTYRVQATTSGVTAISYVTADGVVIKEEEPGGMTMTLSSRQKALDVPETVQNWDILELLAVRSEGTIDNARDCEYMKVELTGIEGVAFNLEDDFQKIVSHSPLVLEIRPSGLKNSTVPSRKYIEPEPMIQSNDSRIMLKARQIVGNLGDENLIIKTLNLWVFSNIEKDYAISLPSATDVLRVKRGDCNEHSALFTALARSLGIPTKICLGIVYKDGLFYYHAWPAVYSAGRWQPIDPTLGQEIADATHIKLLEGSNDSLVGLMRAVGKLNVRIIDYKTKEISTGS